jgi:hypothetical protein
LKCGVNILVARNGIKPGFPVANDSGCVYKMKFTGVRDPDDPAQKPQTWLVDPEGEFYGFDNHGGPQVEGPWQKNWFNYHGVFARDIGNGKSR